MADDLRYFRRGEAILARPVSRLEQVWKWTRRRPVVAGLTGAVVVVTLVGGITSAALWRVTSTALNNERDAKSELTQTNAQLRAELESKLMVLAELEWLGLKPHDALRHLAEIPIQSRDQKWHNLQRACVAEKVVCNLHKMRAVNVSFSSDGGMFAADNNNGSVFVFESTTGKELLAAPLVSRARDRASLQFSVDGFNLTRVSVQSPMQANQERNKIEVKRWNLSAKRLEGNDTKQLPFTVIEATLSPDGRFVAVDSRKPPAIHLLNRESMVELHKFHLPANTYGRFCFSPDSKWLLSATADQFIHVWDLSTGMQSDMWPGVSTHNPAIVFSPNGRLVGVICYYGQNSTWEIQFRDWPTGRIKSSLTNLRQRVDVVAISPDGKQLAWPQSELIRITEIETQKDVLTLRGHTHTITCLAFSPDGTKLISGSEDQTVRVWDLSPISESPNN